MKYVTIFHGNLSYAYLTPDRYEFVIRNSYELILDTMKKKFPDVKFVFEASGYTIEQVAQRTPDVLAKLVEAIRDGRCEFMGSPYSHPMLPNFPKEDGIWSIRFSNEVYEKHLGMRPRSFWNPECGWRNYVPDQAIQTGYANLLGDFEAYSRSCGPDGKPLRPEIYAKEYTKEPAFYNFGFNYDLPGEERAIHFPFEHIQGVPDGKLKAFLRTDRIAQFGVRYFMGMKGYTFEKYMGLIETYSKQAPGEAEGAVIIFADDAEYVGTNGWFRLKYQNKPDNVFERTPASRRKLIELISACQKMGQFVTFDEACNKLPPMKETLAFDDDAAWHGAKASTWANTPMARLLRPWQDLVRQKIHEGADLDEQTKALAWYHLTNSFNSDGQWPPTLPEAPHIVHPFNYGYCFDNLLRAEMLVGGVDRSKLTTDPVKAIREILSMQQDLVLKKADSLLASDDESVKPAAGKARTLVLKSQNVDALAASGQKVLYPSEYATRADALVEARRLVGGVLIEKVEDNKSYIAKK
jgi:alpha-amylase/alpha-mannosidase (GH57 family)